MQAKVNFGCVHYGKEVGAEIFENDTKKIRSTVTHTNSGSGAEGIRGPLRPLLSAFLAGIIQKADKKLNFLNEKLTFPEQETKKLKKLQKVSKSCQLASLYYYKINTCLRRIVYVNIGQAGGNGGDRGTETIIIRYKRI